MTEQVIHLFRTREDNRISTIAKELGMTEYRVDKIINQYLWSLKLKTIRRELAPSPKADSPTSFSQS